MLAREARLQITPQDRLPEDVLRLYGRGSCKGNPGPGGWGVVLSWDGESEQNSGSKRLRRTTAWNCKRRFPACCLFNPAAIVQVFTTSDYLFQGVTRWIHGWRKREWKKRDGQPVANSDLWLALDRLMQEYAIQWVNAKGQDLEELEIAGKLARAASDLD